MLQTIEIQKKEQQREKGPATPKKGNQKKGATTLREREKRQFDIYLYTYG
jgi:hypothetical protein